MTVRSISTAQSAAEVPRVISHGDGTYSPAFAPSSMAVDFSMNALTVTSDSAVASPANPERRYLRIKNGHATADVYVAFGRPATTADYHIAAGEILEFRDVVPANSVTVIGSVASNADCTIVEGSTLSFVDADYVVGGYVQ